MSGGAVVNLKGELVGLTTMASSPAGFDAMAGYAIPIDKIGRRAVETLKEGKEIEYGLLGIKAHLNSTNRVEEVTPNSPADQGQLQANDEILAVDETPVIDFDSLILAINSHRPRRRGAAQDPPRRQGAHEDRGPGEVSGGRRHDRHQPAPRLAGSSRGLSEHRQRPGRWLPHSWSSCPAGCS